MADFAGFLFDMDGTLLTSRAAAERVWTAWARRHGIDPDELLAAIHGVRAIDTVRRFGPPGLDAEAEAAALTEAEIADTEGVAPIAGAAAFLDAIPTERRAVVTSAPRALAAARLGAAGLAAPAVLITAEAVERGKPDPAGFRLAAECLGLDPAECLAFEDAPAGIEAARAAGARVVAVGGGAAPAGVGRIGDYTGLRVVPAGEGRWRLDGPDAAAALGDAA
ncbi:MAG: HAD-IA family hydrolase [Paracoccaceae bacterium]